MKMPIFFIPIALCLLYRSSVAEVRFLSGYLLIFPFNCIWEKQSCSFQFQMGIVSMFTHLNFLYFPFAFLIRHRLCNNYIGDNERFNDELHNTYLNVVSSPKGGIPNLYVILCQLEVLSNR
jgi:hypothetical protein